MTKPGLRTLRGAMYGLPPLDCLRFFYAAARHQSFVRAAGELGVTAAAVAHRIRGLEKHLGAAFFERGRRSVHLTDRGRAYLKDVQRILSEVHGVSERQCLTPRRVRIVSVESVAEKWLLPRLPSFKAAHPDIAIELETNHRGVDPALRDFDARLAYAGETAAPADPARGHAARGDPLRGGADAGVQPGASRRARPAPEPRRACPLAAALRPRLGRRLVLLVRPPGRAHAGPLPRLRQPGSRIPAMGAQRRLPAAIRPARRWSTSPAGARAV